MIKLCYFSCRHSFGEQFSVKKWTKEVAGQREILSAYGGVRLEDIRGMRAPFLSVSTFSSINIGTDTKRIKCIYLYISQG